MTWKISLFIPRSRQFTVAKSSDYTRQKYLCEKDGKIHLLAARKTLKIYSFFAPKKNEIIRTRRLTKFTQILYLERK